LYLSVFEQPAGSIFHSSVNGRSSYYAFRLG
jgi:hypothetical protein